MKRFIIGSAIALMVSSSAYAENVEEKNVALKVGTLGLGLDVSTSIDEQTALRFNINGATVNREETINDINYDADLNLLTLGVLLDYYPSQESSFRLTAGAYYNNNNFDLVAKPDLTEVISIGDVSYTGAEVGQLNAGIEFNKIAPYLGIGFGNKPTSQKGWGFTLDLGAMYQGSAVATAEAMPNDNLPPALKTQLINDVERERQRIEDEMSSYTWYPVIMIGVTYTF